MGRPVLHLGIDFDIPRPFPTRACSSASLGWISNKLLGCLFFFPCSLSLSLSLALVEELRAKQAKHSEEKPQPSLPGYIWLCSKQRSLCQSTALFARRLFFSFSFRERKEFHRKKGSKERRGDDEGKSHQGLLQRPSKVGRESQGPLENQGENTDIIYADEWVWCGKVAQARNYGRATDRRDVFI